MKNAAKDLVFCLVILGCWFATDSLAELSSGNYRITTSVISGGGGKVESSSFKLDGTSGQPTPLTNQPNPPSSPSYVMYPGYWHTNESVSACDGDTEPDGDVDGVDLASFANEMAQGATLLNISDFAGTFGTIDCQ